MSTVKKSQSSIDNSFCPYTSTQKEGLKLTHISPCAWLCSIHNHASPNGRFNFFFYWQVIEYILHGLDFEPTISHSIYSYKGRKYISEVMEKRNMTLYVESLFFFSADGFNKCVQYNAWVYKWLQIKLVHSWYQKIVLLIILILRIIILHKNIICHIRTEKILDKIDDQVI